MQQNPVHSCIHSEALFCYGEGLPGTAWQTKSIQLWRELGQHPDFVRREAAAKAGLKTAYALPLNDHQGTMGVLVAASKLDLAHPHDFAPLFSEFGQQLGAEIRRKLLEEELSHAFELTPDILCVSTPAGELKKVNPAMSRILGYRESDLLKMQWQDLLHPSEVSHLLDQFKALETSGLNQRFETLCLTAAGNLKWLAWTAAYAKNEGLIYCAAKDISDEKELRQWLDKANQLARIGSWKVNLLTQKLFWSSITRQIFEVAPDFQPDS